MPVARIDTDHRRRPTRPMAKPGVGMEYGAPMTYHRLIAPRYAPIAQALVTAAEPASGERVLEVGAGTGLVTRLTADRVGSCGSLYATDRSRAMLEVAREGSRHGNTSFLLVDYHEPLPFLDASFDLVLSGLTYVQNSAPGLAEVARVLRPGGRIGIAMWGRYYEEVRLMSNARRALGRPPYPSAAPGRAMRRLERAGFRELKRSDLELAPRFADVSDYIAYRRGFGVPVGSTRAEHERYLEALRTEALRATAPDGSLTLGWTLTVMTARRR